MFCLELSGKYAQNDRDILMSVLLIVCARPEPVKFYKIEPRDYWVDLHLRNDVIIWCTAVFCVRTCIPTTIGGMYKLFKYSCIK